jgi:hypothetical protein
MTPLPQARAIPIEPPADDSYRGAADLPLGAATSGSICLSRAEDEAERLLRRCKDQVRRGERWAILELLEINPEFIVVPWVREMLGRFLRGGLPLRALGGHRTDTSGTR